MKQTSQRLRTVPKVSLLSLKDMEKVSRHGRRVKRRLKISIYAILHMWSRQECLCGCDVKVVI